MNAVKKEDQPKLIALLVVMFLIFGIAFLRVKAVLTPDEPAPGAQTLAVTPAPAAAPAAGTLVASNAAASPDDGEIEVPTLFASTSADPFRNVVPKPVITTAVIAPIRRRPRIRPVDPSLGMGAMSGTIQALPAPGPGPAAPAVEVVHQDPIHLSGVMPGKNAVAILQIGKDTYVVRKGEHFGENMVVTNVDKNGVQIQRGTETVNVGIGQ